MFFFYTLVCKQLVEVVGGGFVINAAYPVYFKDKRENITNMENSQGLLNHDFALGGSVTKKIICIRG